MRALPLFLGSLCGVVACADDASPAASADQGSDADPTSTGPTDPSGSPSDGPGDGLADTGPTDTTALPEPTPWDLSWTFFDVGEGSKPAMAAAGAGGVHLAYLWEDTGGWIRHVQIPPGAADAPAPVDVATGYFYGPIDVAALADGSAVVAYHDHDMEDQVLAVGGGAGGFSLQPMGGEGHDGWYPSITVDAADVVHTATIDPAQFVGVGVRYGRYDGTWTVETAATGDLDYKNGLSIAVTGSGTIYIAYFDDMAGTANVARKGVGGSWDTRVVETKGSYLDVGYFPQLRVGSDGQTLHLTYLARAGAESGTIRYARGAWDAMELFDLAEIDDLPIAMELGTARTPVSIALRDDGTPVIAYQNSTTLRVAMITGDALLINETQVAGAGVGFGRQVAVEVTGDGVLHLAYWQDDGALPGTVRYGWAQL